MSVISESVLNLQMYTNYAYYALCVARQTVVYTYNEKIRSKCEI